MNNNIHKQTILFIGKAKNAPDAALLPEEAGLQQEPDVRRALKYLQRAPEKAPPALILVGPEQNSAAVCRQLQADEPAAVYPIIPILPDAAQRTAVLEAGAADYLLVPLTRAELQTRLRPWFAPQNNWQPRFLRHLLADVEAGVPLAQALTEHLPDIGAAFGAQKITLRRANQTTPVPPHTLLFPIPGKNRAGKYLQLTFAAPPQLPPWEKHLLTWLAEMIGVLLDVSQAQEEVQTYATQSALLTLTFRLLSEQSDLAPLLDIALERTSMMMTVSAGSLWLFSPDGRWLTPAAEFSSRFAAPLLPRLPADKGLMGWAARLKKPAALDLQANLPQLSAEYDHCWAGNGRYLLITPLRRQNKLTGFLVQQNDTTPYEQKDIALVEEIAGPAANAIANAIDLKMAREAGEKQRALYQMSRQLTDSLEMDVVLHRAAVWAARICPAEYSLLWLIDDSQTRLRLAAAFGLKQPPQTVTLPVGESRIGQSAALGRILPEKPDALSLPETEKEWLQNHLGISARNLLAVPIIYQELCIGVITLINSPGDSCLKEEIAMVVTASRIAAGAIGNAALYAHTQRLMEERERSRRQAIQSARLAVVGRLTASLAHEINNPMQAIRGALLLTLEERDDPEAVREYVSLSLEETERVTQTVSRMRHIYAAENRAPEAVDINVTLQEVTAVTYKELQRHKTTLQLETAEKTPLQVWGYAPQLRLAFLNAALTLGDIIGKQGGGNLTVRPGAAGEWVYVEWRATAASFVTAIQKMLENETAQETGFGISLCRDIVTTHGGNLRLLNQPDDQVLRIELPAHND